MEELFSWKNCNLKQQQSETHLGRNVIQEVFISVQSSQVTQETNTGRKFFKIIGADVHLRKWSQSECVQCEPFWWKSATIFEIWSFTGNSWKVWDEEKKLLLTLQWKLGMMSIDCHLPSMSSNCSAGLKRERNENSTIAEMHAKQWIEEMWKQKNQCPTNVFRQLLQQVRGQVKIS